MATRRRLKYAEAWLIEAEVGECDNVALMEDVADFLAELGDETTLFSVQFSNEMDPDYRERVLVTFERNDKDVVTLDGGITVERVGQ